MTRDIIRFEWRYHTRQISFAASVLLFLIFGFALTATGFGPANVHIDSPFSIAQSIGTLSLLSVFVLAVFCANAVVRDRDVQFEEIVFTTSVEKLPFLLGRFTGSFLAAFTAFSASVVGMVAARFMPWQDATRLGAFNPLAYLWALFVIALPNLLFAAVVLFALATITRSVLASYAGSVLLYVLYFAGAAMTNSPLLAGSSPGANEGTGLAALLDPFALSAFFEQTRHWTAIERNTRLVSLSGNFALNRLLWIGASFVLLGVVYRLFSFRVTSRSARAAEPPPEAETASLQPAGRRRSRTNAYFSTTKIALRSFVFSAPFAAITLLWIALVTFQLISDLGSGEYGAATYPASGLLLATIHQPLTMLATILIIYLSGELVWRERALRFAEVLNATPAGNAVFVLSKWSVLAAIVGVLTATAYLAGAVLQLAKGWTVEPRLLFAFAWFDAIPLLIFAAAAIVIQTLMPHKYAAMLVVLLLGIFMQQGELLGVEQPLLRFAGGPDVWWSDMSGFAGARDFHLLMLYWGAFAGLLLLVAIAKWRGTRMRIARVPAIVFATIFLASGAFIFATTAYEPRSRQLDWQAEYERQYRRFASTPKPHVTDVRATVDLDPHARRYHVRGEYTLVNNHTAPLAQVLITVPREAKNAKVTLANATARGQLFQFAQPLPPSSRTTLRFDLTYEDDELIAENGSVIMSPRALPAIGYREGYQIDDAQERRRRGLPPLADERRERVEHEELETTDWVRLDLTISTLADQIAVTSGTLVSDTRRGNRRISRFVAREPIPNSFVISSARYAVARTVDRGVTVEVYHHPSHTQNVDRILRAAKESLAYYRDAFGPYAYDRLRIAEVPVKNFSALAQPGAIFFGEVRGFLVDARDRTRLDLVYRRVAHEVSHQWWGGTLVPADAPGGSMLNESLPKYSELVMLERAYGKEAVRQLLSYELDLYLSGRTGERESEPPLARAGSQPYLYYRKGAVVMHALHDLLGERAMNAALRNLLHQHGGPNARPVAAHLLQQLHAVASPEQHPLIDEWLNDVVLYDLKLVSATTRKLAANRYEVTLTIDAAKQRDGGPTLPMSEPIELGVYSRDDRALFLAKQVIRSGRQTITLTVNEEPSAAAVDPYITRIDTSRFDNVVAIR